MKKSLLKTAGVGATVFVASFVVSAALFTAAPTANAYSIYSTSTGNPSSGSATDLQGGWNNLTSPYNNFVNSIQAVGSDVNGQVTDMRAVVSSSMDSMSGVTKIAANVSTTDLSGQVNDWLYGKIGFSPWGTWRAILGWFTGISNWINGRI